MKSATYHLPLPPSWDHTAYIAQGTTGAGDEVFRIIQIEAATHGTNPLDHTVTTRDAELFGISDWPTAEAARQAAIDASLTLLARADLFDHIAYLRDRATKIHAALAQVAASASASSSEISNLKSEMPVFRPCPHSPPKLPKWPLRDPRPAHNPDDIELAPYTHPAPYGDGHPITR